MHVHNNSGPIVRRQRCSPKWNLIKCAFPGQIFFSAICITSVNLVQTDMGGHAFLTNQECGARWVAVIRAADCFLGYTIRKNLEQWMWAGLKTVNIPFVNRIVEAQHRFFNTSLSRMVFLLMQLTALCRGRGSTQSKFVLMCNLLAK